MVNKNITAKFDYRYKIREETISQFPLIKGEDDYELAKRICDSLAEKGYEREEIYDLRLTCE